MIKTFKTKNELQRFIMCNAVFDKIKETYLWNPIEDFEQKTENEEIEIGEIVDCISFNSDEDLAKILSNFDEIKSKSEFVLGEWKIVCNNLKILVERE